MGRREELLVPLVPPWAAYVIDREYGKALEERGRVLASSERTAPIGRDLLLAVRQLREAARRQWEAHEAAGCNPGDAVPAGSGDADVRSSKVHSVTPKAAAPLLGVSERQVVTMCQREQLDAVQVGGRWLIDEVSVAAESERRRAPRDP